MGVRESFWSVFGFDAKEPSSIILASVRSAMLRVLDAHSGADHFQLDVKICDAKDIATLWYLRPELMHAIASSEGEAVATVCIAGLTELFQGQQPGGHAARATAG